MENIELLKQINKLQQALIKKGIVVDKVIKELKVLRGFFIDEKMPRMVKLIRLTYEHIESYNTFDILMPVDEDEDEDIIADNSLSTEEQKVDSLKYLLDLLTKPTQKLNAEDLDYYLNALKTYAEEN